MLPSTLSWIICLIWMVSATGSSDSLISAQPPSIQTRGQTYRVPVGSTAKLACKVLVLGDSTQLWKNGTRVLFVGRLQIRSDPRVSRSKDELVIKQVTVYDTGPYTCEVEANREEQILVQHFLQALEAPVIPASGPASVTVRAGTTVSLACRPTGHPQPTIAWTKLGESTRTGPLANSPVLTIEAAQRPDEGVYQCAADNGVGSPVTRKILLRVLYPPEVTAVRTPVHASVGWGVNISCDVWSDPPAELTWLKGGRQLDPHTLYQQMTVSGAVRHSLSLVPQQKEDITNFSCLASNKMGRGEANVLLTGLPSPPLVSSGELSASRSSYLLAWRTDSFTEILQYNVLYRKLPMGAIVYAWDSADISGDSLQQVRDATGQTVLQQYQVDNLSPDSAFVAKIKARNAVGWSDFSMEFLFYTQGKDSPPVESHVLTSGQEGPPCPLPPLLLLLLTSLWRPTTRNMAA